MKNSLNANCIILFQGEPTGFTTRGKGKSWKIVCFNLFNTTFLPVVATADVDVVVFYPKLPTFVMLM